MAKYRETWQSPNIPTIVGYYDTETGVHIPIDPANGHYQDVLLWLQSNTADPHYTQEEIDAMAMAEKQAKAENYLSETSALVQSYRDAIAAGRLPPIPTAKYKKILNQRRRAARKINKTVSKFIIN